MQKISVGKGRTLGAAIEHALSAAKLPPPYKFELITIGGRCSVETELFYEVRVKLTQEETLEQTAERRSSWRPSGPGAQRSGSECVVCDDSLRVELVSGELADCEKCAGDS